MKSLAELKTGAVVQKCMKLPDLSQGSLDQIIRISENKNELSIYLPGKASAETMIWAMKKLMGCFPDTTPEVFETLTEMIKSEQWSDNRVKDAVREAIKTHKYPRITPANILDYDKRIKLYTLDQVHEDAYKRNGHHFDCMKGFEKVDLNGWIMYYKENDHRFAHKMGPAPLPEKTANKRAYHSINN